MPTPYTASVAARNPAFACHDERERLLVEYVGLVRELGYENVSLGVLAERAGVEAGVVPSQFGGPLECALAACDASSAQCFSTVAETVMNTAGDPPLVARAALAAMLGAMAGMPDFVHLIVVEFPRLGARAERQRRRYFDQFAEFLGPGFAAADPMPAQPEVVSLIIAGGIYDVVARHYLDGRLHELPRALPGVVYITVAPFFGVEAARRVAALPERSQE